VTGVNHGVGHQDEGHVGVGSILGDAEDDEDAFLDF
jgi:hypothetical protein